MNKPTHVKYLGVEEGAFTEELVLVFSDEEGKRIELSIAREHAEILFDELEPFVYVED